MKQKPKIVFRKCSVCDKVVKATLFKKENRFFDYYLCLDNLQAREFHAFKVPTNAYYQAQAMEEGTKNAALLASVILVTLPQTPDVPPPDSSPDTLATLDGVSSEEGTFLIDLLTSLTDFAG